MTAAYVDDDLSYKVEFVGATGAVLGRTVVKEAHLSGVEDA